MSETTERIWCMTCGKSVSTEVPKNTIVRAWVECPECIEKRGGRKERTKPVGKLKDVSDGYHTFGELYEHRYALFAALCASVGPRLSWKSKLHSDGKMFLDSFIAGIETPLGMATYHMPLSWWDEFHCKELERAPQWDGHTSKDVLKRLAALERDLWLNDK